MNKTLEKQIDSGVNDKIVDEMPVSGSIIALLLLGIGIYMGYMHNIGYLFISIVGSTFSVMISVGLGWNKIFLREDFAPITPIFHLALSSIIQFVLAYIGLAFLLNHGIFLLGSLSLLTALVYQYILLKIIFKSHDRTNVEVGEHPKREESTKYAFKESVYIPLLEEEALKKQDS